MPSTFERLTKARQQVQCAKEETTNQQLLKDLTEVAAHLATVMNDLKEGQYK